MFAEWLWVSLQSFYISSFSKGGNKHIRLLIEEQESVCEVLVYIYEKCVPNTKQLMFRQAIGDVLREHGDDKDAPISAFQDLIYLVARIRAAEPLSALLPTVGNGLLGKRQPSLLYETFAVLKSFTPSPQIYEMVYDLISSVNFDEGYLFEAIKILIDCEPSHASDIINAIKPRLVELRQTVNLDEKEWIAFCEAANNCAQHISALSNDIIADAVLKLVVK